MKLLAIDTSTEACSASLSIDGDISSLYQVAPREHSRLILGMIEQLLSDSGTHVDQLDALAFGRGPGSFMGLRIAAGVIQGIAFAHDIPVIGVSTLMAIAQNAYEKTGSRHVLAAIDARMDEVYWCPYTLTETGDDSFSWQILEEEQVISPDNIDLGHIMEQRNEWVAAGTGWASYKDRLLASCRQEPGAVLGDCLPGAEQIVRLATADLMAGEVMSAAQAIPVYLRNDVARKPKAVKL